MQLALEAFTVTSTSWMLRRMLADVADPCGDVHIKSAKIIAGVAEFMTDSLLYIYQVVFHRSSLPVAQYRYFLTYAR